jgi:hypothetical protein
MEGRESKGGGASSLSLTVVNQPICCITDFDYPAFSGAVAVGLIAGVAEAPAGPLAVAVVSDGRAAFRPGVVAVASAGPAAFQPGAVAASVAAAAFQPGVVVAPPAGAVGCEPAAVALLGRPGPVVAAVPCPIAVAGAFSIPAPPVVGPAAIAVPDVALIGLPGMPAARPVGSRGAPGVAVGSLAAIAWRRRSKRPHSEQRNSPKTDRMSCLPFQRGSS